MNKRLADFAVKAQGLEVRDKLKLILFATGQKPSTYVALKTIPKNLGEKHHLEKHLKNFIVSRPKGFEQITRVQKNKVFWDFKGIWHGYDIFANKKLRQQFLRYKKLLSQQKHAAADKLGGKIYGYPSCCVKQYIKEHDKHYLREHYTHYEYYKKLYDSERAFPFVLHIPCSPECKKTKQMNQKYERAVRKITPEFYRDYWTGKVHRTKFLVDGESELKLKPAAKPVWSAKERDGHEYSLISLTPYKGNYYLYSYLTKTRLPRGTVFQGRAVRKHFYADIKLTKYKNVYPTVSHYRRFASP